MDDSELAYLSIDDLAARLRRRALSPVELTHALLERTARLEPTLHAYITVTAEAALEEADCAEKELVAGHDRGPLHGVPVAVKDCFWTTGVRTTNGSRVFADFVPSEDATAVARLRQAGAVLLGKTNVPELCFANFREHPFGIPRNPWDPSRYPGISSAGSAIALAAGMAYGALGSDTGGSIRNPAAFCGVTGLKPTYGRISLFGAFPLCRDYDHAGPMARSVRDCAHLLDALAGHDLRDPTSLNAALPSGGWAAALTEAISPLRIGVPRAHFWGELLQPDVAEAAEATLGVWRELGWPVRDVELPPIEPIVAAADLVHEVDAASEYRDLLTARPAVLGPDFRAWAEPGLRHAAVDYVAARRTWQAFGRALEGVFRGVDVLVTPTRAGTAPRQSEDGTLLDPLPPEGFRGLFNLPGVPALSVPAGLDRNGLPIGVQLIGPRLGEAAVLAAGHALQLRTAWHRQRPRLANGCLP